MTRQRNDNHSTEFGLWLRKQKEIDSCYGFVASDLDYIWQNYKTKQWMLIEEKRFMSNLTWSQTQLFKFLIGRLKYDPKFYGFFLVQFERTSPDDGYIYINHERITKEMLIKFLRFEYIIPSLVLTNPNKQLIYLAIPYSGMEELSFDVSRRITLMLMQCGKNVYSPIIHGHSLVSTPGYSLHFDHDFWMKHDLDMLRRCDELYVVALDGWNKSVGVLAEIKEARELGMPITFLDPDMFVSDEREIKILL